MSEELDGVRAYWDGTVFLSRAGNQFHASVWFTEGLPSDEDGLTLDGELFSGRGQPNTTVGVVRNAADKRGCTLFSMPPLWPPCRSSSVWRI